LPKQAEYIENYHNYQIYIIQEAYIMSDGTITHRYVAIQPEKHWVIDGVDLPDLKSDIDESYR
jgi:hypothetical protein